MAQLSFRLPELTDERLGEVRDRIVVERTRGDFCGCCGGHDSSFERLDETRSVGTTNVVGGVLFACAVVSMTMLMVLVWSIEVQEDVSVSEVSSGTFAS